MPNETIENIVKAASRGDPEAVARLYELNHQVIFRFLYYRTGSQTSAEDLTSEVFLRMVKSLVGFQLGQGDIAAWLHQIARRVLYDWYRQNEAHPESELTELHADAAALPEDAADKKLEHEILAKTLQGLPSDQQEVLILRFINGFSLQTTAEIIHRSVDAVKGLQSRAIQALRTRLTERGVL